VTVKAEVYRQLEENYPPSAIRWVRDAKWEGPCLIDHHDIDYDDVEHWSATHEPATVNKFARKMRKGKGHLNPVVMVQQTTGDDRFKCVDGHHRLLAYHMLGAPVKAFVGQVSVHDDRWEETHSSQYHQGSSPQNKNILPGMMKCLSSTNPKIREKAWELISGA
jgi:hypothetical protein